MYQLRNILLIFFSIQSTYGARYFNDFRFEDGTPIKEQFKEEYITNASTL